MSHKINDTVYETEKEITLDMLHEGMKRSRNEMGGVSLEEIADIITQELGADFQFLLKEFTEKFTVEQDLNALQVIIARLKKEGVDLNIISDTIINALPYADINRMCSNLDAYLRQEKF